MKKKVILRGLLGVPLGIAISYVITLIISLVVGDGLYYSVTPRLIETAGSELNAVLLQTVLSSIMGAGFSMASVIWEIDTWSLAKQSGTYFAIICIITFPISYFSGWMPSTVAGIVLFVILFVIIFVIIFVTVWLIQYFIWKSKINKLNEKVKKDI